jgi:hypothetical protein
VPDDFIGGAGGGTTVGVGKVVGDLDSCDQRRAEEVLVVDAAVTLWEPLIDDGVLRLLLVRQVVFAEVEHL